ncbi:MAG: hypothetical protein K2P26_09895, partial [Oscillospiraceae bacterium]|nr:hypothetical protein [Oscillospiraceae bacterium]
MIRTLQHSKQRKGRPQPANFKAGQWAAFFISRLFTLVVMLALSLNRWIYTRKEPFIKRHNLRAVTKKSTPCDKIQQHEKNTIVKSCFF